MPTQRHSNSAGSTLLLPPHVKVSSHTLFELHTEWRVLGASHGEAEFLRQANVDHEDLGRGVRWALAIELAAALGIYAIWSLCHFLL